MAVTGRGGDTSNLLQLTTCLIAPLFGVLHVPVGTSDPYHANRALHDYQSYHYCLTLTLTHSCLNPSQREQLQLVPIGRLSPQTKFELNSMLQTEVMAV